MSTPAPPGEVAKPDDAREPSRVRATSQVALQPRWLWIVFAVAALAVPAIGLWLERSP